MAQSFQGKHICKEEEQGNLSSNDFGSSFMEKVTGETKNQEKEPMREEIRKPEQEGRFTESSEFCSNERKTPKNEEKACFDTNFFKKPSGFFGGSIFGGNPAVFTGGQQIQRVGEKMREEFGRNEKKKEPIEESRNSEKSCQQESSLSRSLSLFCKKNQAESTGFHNFGKGLQTASSHSIFSSNSSQLFGHTSLFSCPKNSFGKTVMRDISNQFKSMSNIGFNTQKSEENAKKILEACDTAEDNTAVSSLKSSQDIGTLKTKESLFEWPKEGNFTSSEKKRKLKIFGGLFEGACQKKQCSIFEIDLKGEKSFLEKENLPIKRDRGAAGLFDIIIKKKPCQRLKPNESQVTQIELIKITKEKDELTLKSKKKIKKFPCYDDESHVDIPENLKDLTKPLKNDEDIESDDELVEKGVVRSYKQMLEGLMRHKGEDQAKEIYEEYNEPEWIKRWN